MKTTLKVKHIVGIILLLVLVVGLITIVPWGLRVYDNACELQSISGELRSLKSEGLKPEKLPEALTLVERTSSTVTALRIDIAPLFPLFSRLGSLPRYGSYLLVVEPGLVYIDSLAQAAVLLGNAALPLVNNQSTGSPLEMIAAQLEEQSTNLDKAEALLKQAADAGAHIDTAVIPQKFIDDFKQLNSLLEIAPPSFQAVRILASLLGSPQPRTYLILVQNRDELRASGGFISAFGLLGLDKGRISMLEIEDSTLYNHVFEVQRPPEPIEKIMLANYLVARDANWSPDFPTAARQVQNIYKLPTDIPKDGVIAFDQGFIVRLLAFLGPVSIPGENEPVTSTNVETLMIESKQSAITAGHHKERKEFLTVFAPYFIQKLSAVNTTEKQIGLARLLMDTLREGHLLVYFNDPEAQRLLTENKLDNSIDAGQADFLMVVDSNLGISKVDQFIRRSLTYKVDLKNPNIPTAILNMRYQHTKPGTDPCHMGISHSYLDPEVVSYYFSRCYWNYFRVLTSQGTRLTKTDLQPVPMDYFGHHSAWPDGIRTGIGEGDTQMFGGLLVIPQLQEREVTLNFELPHGVLRQEGDTLIYNLRIQKQAGIESLPVEIRVIPPDGTSLSEPASGWISTTDKDYVFWQGKITRTRDFELKFVPESLNP